MTYLRRIFVAGKPVTHFGHGHGLSYKARKSLGLLQKEEIKDAVARDTGNRDERVNQTSRRNGALDI